MRNEDAQAGFHCSRHNTAVAHGRKRGDPEFPSEQARLIAVPPRSWAAACTGRRVGRRPQGNNCATAASPPHRPRTPYAIRLSGSRHVIPGDRGATDRESISHICLSRRLRIPGQIFGLPGMTIPAKRSNAVRTIG